MASGLPGIDVDVLLEHHENASNYTRDEQGYYKDDHHGVALASWNLAYVATPLIICLFLILAGALKLGDYLLLAPVSLHYQGNNLLISYSFSLCFRLVICSTRVLVSYQNEKC